MMGGPSWVTSSSMSGSTSMLIRPSISSTVGGSATASSRIASSIAEAWSPSSDARKSWLARVAASAARRIQTSASAFSPRAKSVLAV